MEEQQQLPSDIEQVLEFLRKNGLTVSESALMDDILEKSQLSSFDFQRFIFPIIPPSLPSLNIPAAPPPPQTVEEEVNCSSSSDDDEFVSLPSSSSTTTDFCSSEFTNPYGIRTTRGVSSHASSDRLSQFGTARDYHDFDLQNDFNWYTEKNEDYDMPPLFDNSDPISGTTEDKFVMTSEKENQDDNQQLFLDPILDPFSQTHYLVKPWPLTLTSIGYAKDGVKIVDYYDLDGKCVEQDVNGNIINVKDFQESNIVHKSDVCSLCHEENERSCDCYLVGGSRNAHEPQRQMGEKDVDFNMVSDSEGSYGRNLHEHRKRNAEIKEGDPNAINNELLMYANEDDYEIFDLRIIHRKNRTGFEENKDLPVVIDSVIGSRYCVTEYLGSAAFSKVVQAHDLQMGIDVCLKIIKNDKDFFDQSLDEIKLLKFVNKYDPADERHILRLYDYFYFQEHLIIVCELLRANLYEYQRYNKECGGEPYFTLNRLQVITRQCLEALEYLHELGIIHCDLKPENILIKSYSRCEIKVIDLGSSCFQNDSLSLYVQSRSYRAPEVIIGLPYNQSIDLWSLGCILAELYSGDVLFPNNGLVVLLARVIGMLGRIDIEMLKSGQETDKYFTKDFDLYHINEIFIQIIRATPSLINYSSSDSSPSFEPLSVVELTESVESPQPYASSAVTISPVGDDSDRSKKLTVVLDLDETLVCAYETSTLPVIVRNQAIDAGLKWFELECVSSDKECEGKPKVNYVTVFERPGLDEFLTQLSKFADLVLFTAGLEGYAKPLVDRIDAENRFGRRLYRPSTSSTEFREHVKDLSCISTNFCRIVIVDNNPFSFLLQPVNGIPCIPFSAGQPHDDQLLEVLLPLLKQLSEVGDVRSVLYEKFHMPEWFHKHGIPSSSWATHG